MNKKNELAFVLGASLLYILAIFVLPSLCDKVKLFERENKPDVIRIYKVGMDSIRVEGTAEGDFYSLETYLKTIPDKPERALEEVEIKALIKWYE